MKQNLHGIEAQKVKQKPQQNIFLNKKIVAPQKLKILVLSGNDIVNEELEFIQKCVNLHKLDISNNHITKITPKVKMNQLTNLKILYMHNNRIENIQGLDGIFEIPNLLHLTIRGNPIEKIPRIEHLIVNMIPQLKILGQRVIFVQQRSADVFDARQNIFIQPQLAQGWKSQDNRQSHYMKILQLQLRYFQNVWYFSNPIIKIQRFWKQKYVQIKQKKVWVRTKIKKNYDDENSFQGANQSVLFDFFYEWKQFTRKRRAVVEALDNGKEYHENSVYLTYPLSQYKTMQRNIKVSQTTRIFVKNIRHRIFVRKMAERVKRQLKKKQIQFNGHNSFFEISGIKNCGKFYFSKIQSHLIQNILAHISKNFGWQEKIQKSTNFGSVKDYLSIRMVDPQTYTVKRIYSVFTYFLWPSMKVIFLKKKKVQSTQKTGLIKIKPLYYIKNKNKRITAQQHKKSNRIYKKLQKFYKKQYENSVDYFQCNDPQVMKMVLRYIYYHNSKTNILPKILNKNQMQSLLQNYEEPFMIYAEDLIKRTAAAVRIQQNWRKYLIHKKQSDSIYAKMKATRAVFRIQRFWRDQVFYHRLSFHKLITHQLKLFTGSTILLPVEIYKYIQQICSQTSKVNLYQDLHILLDRNRSQIVCTWKYDNEVIPQLIQKSFLPNLRKNSQFDRNNSTKIDIYQILHYKSQVCRTQYKNNEYFQFQYSTVQECRLRVYIIALISYRIYGSKMLLPLSKQTLDLQYIRFQQYKQLNKCLKTLFEQKIMKHKSNIYENKIITLRQFKETGLFIYPSCSSTYIPNRKQFKVYLQFYQKMFRDFPKKFIETLYYMLPSQIMEQQAQIKKKLIQNLVEEKQIQLQQFEQSVNKSIEIQQSVTNNMDGFNISKIDKKKLSYYDAGSKTGTNFQQEKSFMSEMHKLANTADINQRKTKVSRIKIEQKSKKEEFKQKKKSDLKAKKQSIKQQKDQVNNLRNINEIERSEILRQKVQKVKSFKNRLSGSKRRDSEQDFIQQGNFVMQQQLKMVIMRTKMSNMHNRSQKKQKSEILTRKNRSFFAPSPQITQMDKRQRQEVRNQTLPIRSRQIVPHQQTYSSAQDDFEGGQRKIVNTRNFSRKNRTHSIGAYLRDPSYVHGVFPEQYYPISSKGATFKFFPPL